jgi:hypothetical protein
MANMRFGMAAALFLAATAVRADELRDLFDGKTLDGWVVEGPAVDKQGKTVWTVRDGMIVASGKVYGFLRYDRQKFGDFALRVEYRFTPTKVKKDVGNSGIGIRTGPFDAKKSALTRPSFAAYEIQLLDDAGKKPDAHSSASLYRYAAPTANKVKPAPEWNAIEVECVGPRIKVTMNGTLVLDVDQTKLADIAQRPAGAPSPKDKPLSGSIALQSHSGPVEFRKVQVREIKVGPATTAPPAGP